MNKLHYKWLGILRPIKYSINCRLLQGKRNIWLMFKLNYKCCTWCTEENWARPELVVGKLQVLNDSDVKGYERITGDSEQRDEKKKMTFGQRKC